MHEDLAKRVEAYLLHRADWVPVEDVCTACEIPERLLRADGRRRPITSRFAISSSTRGLKHLRHATVAERLAYKHSRWKVLISYRRALDDYRHAVAATLHPTATPPREIHSGQLVFFP